MTTYPKQPIYQSLGKTPNLKVMMFFLEHPTNDYTKTEIAANCNLARQSVYPVIRSLMRFQFIKIRRQIGNTKLYCLHDGSTTRAFRQIVQTLSK